MDASGLPNRFHKEVVMIRKILCRLGFHRWEELHEIFETIDGMLVTIMWLECNECMETKLFMIDSDRTFLE